jgi:hypothetical protein
MLYKINATVRYQGKTGVGKKNILGPKEVKEQQKPWR